eukprot:TRINITY_DN32767_c0_g1_i1.p1 TRINITY_DN32767_c0_g1~~TRINITY_DN32767_c0_g1_i1.p1  ORF type:complete len:140 (-),score=11.48 TRINITY_DN32767_c0_g1_i1:109-528(-)
MVDTANESHDKLESQSRRAKPDSISGIPREILAKPESPKSDPSSVDLREVLPTTSGSAQSTPSSSSRNGQGGAGQLACGDEAVRLLNCVSQLNYLEGRCVILMGHLRKCCEKKNVRTFSLLSEDSRELPPADSKKLPPS